LKSCCWFWTMFLFWYVWSVSNTSVVISGAWQTYTPARREELLGRDIPPQRHLAPELLVVWEGRHDWAHRRGCCLGSGNRVEDGRDVVGVGVQGATGLGNLGLGSPNCHRAECSCRDESKRCYPRPVSKGSPTR
jgi:hypothetical protein